jgi:hypothetical protein
MNPNKILSHRCWSKIIDYAIDDEKVLNMVSNMMTYKCCCKNWDRVGSAVVI